MAWLTDSNTDYIVTAKKVYRVKLTGVDMDGSPVSWYRDVTSTSKYAGGMTYDTAETARAAYKTANPTAEVEVQRENDAGSYRVVITETDLPAWAED